ncbi:hypothetical protein Tco_0040180 [Tanacetum coccineum]
MSDFSRLSSLDADKDGGVLGLTTSLPLVLVGTGGSVSVAGFAGTRTLVITYGPFNIHDEVFLALGWDLEEIHVTWAHLEKKRTRLRLYTKSLKKLCIQSVETASRVSSDGVRMFEVTKSEIYPKIDINYAASGNLKRLSTEEAWETIEDYAQCDKQCKNPTSTTFDQTIANLKAQLIENEMVRVMIPKCMIWLDAYDKPIGDMEDKVDNLSSQDTPQVLLSFEVCTPHVTYLEEVDETIGIPMEVEPLDHRKLEDLGLNTNTHDFFLSFKGFPSVDEPRPQLLPNFLTLRCKSRRQKRNRPTH